jgi:hypothetical protein
MVRSTIHSTFRVYHFGSCDLIILADQWEITMSGRAPRAVAELFTIGFPRTRVSPSVVRRCQSRQSMSLPERSAATTAKAERRKTREIRNSMVCARQEPHVSLGYSHRMSGQLVCSQATNYPEIAIVCIAYTSTNSDFSASPGQPRNHISRHC